jgi:hypothetical protein
MELEQEIFLHANVLLEHSLNNKEPLKCLNARHVQLVITVKVEPQNLSLVLQERSIACQEYNR